MPISTKLNAPPFNDDFDPFKFYYKILWQPGQSVQTRELNQLQSILQNQIEKFGDNIFTSGTIISGCNFGFMNPYPYVKILDLDITGAQTQPYRYVNYSLINETTGLNAWILNFADGFESTSPNLKTLYLRYQGFGANGSTTSYAPGDILKVYDPAVYGIEDVTVTNGGSGFSNNDQLVVMSPLIVSINSGTLTPGDYLTNGVGANVQIVSVDSTTYANTRQYIVQVKPRPADLANASANALFWTISGGQTVANPGATLSANVASVIGFGFKGVIKTNSTGTIVDTVVTSKGAQYKVQPIVTVRSINNSTGYNSLALVAQNYITKVTVGASADAVGNGYALSISEGVIYQKGYFLQSMPQTVVVSKYDTYPDNVAVGFSTTETIVDSSIDRSLLDNVNSTQNAQAPGASRLMLVPQLTLVTTDYLTQNTDFLPLVTWKEGQPYKQAQDTTYSVIGDEMAVRTNEQSGNFVTDPFLVTTRSPLNSNNEGNTYNVVIDPGTAYISGYRVQTKDNYSLDVPKSTATAITNTHAISLNYGNYLRIREVGGVFNFGQGDTVQLFNAPRLFLSNGAALASGPTSSGTQIGTANIRSLMHESGSAGFANTTYLLYVYNIKMSPGANFGDVRSVYYNGTLKGVADVITQTDSRTTVVSAQLLDTAQDALLFPAGVQSLKNANNVNYTYRTLTTGVTFANNGVLTYDISANGPEYFTATAGPLTSTQMQDLYVTVTGTSIVATAQTVGTLSINTTSNAAIGTSTTFLADYAAGDYVSLTANSTGGAYIAQVISVVNNTYMAFSSTPTFANATALSFRTYPTGVPLPFGYRSGLTANVNITNQVLTLALGNTFSFSGTRAAALGVNIQRFGVTQLTKTPNRNVFVKFSTANTINGGVNGPWCLGVPDAFRLRGVYVGDVNVSNTSTNIAQNFYIDHNQNSDFYDLSYLYIKPTSGQILDANSYVLCQFDYFTSTGAGFFDTVSYVSANSAVVQNTNSQPLSALTSAVNMFEIPEVFDNAGFEYDLLQYIDFRPRVANTVAPSTTFAGAPIDPSPVGVLATTGEKKFPLPDSAFTCTMEYYLSRTDSVFVDKKGQFLVLQGKTSANNEYLPPTQPLDTLKLTDIVVPAYPSLAIQLNDNMTTILNTNIANQKFSTTRQKIKVIKGPTSNTVLPYNQPRVYTNYDIGNLDRRLKAVEYITTLNALEAGLANKNIPSSVDPSADRFKFGLFVDNFTTSDYSEISNPQYAAQLEGTDIVPPKMTWDISFVGSGHPPYLDFPIVTQTTATIGSVQDPLSLGPICALNLSNTVAYTQIYRNSQDADLVRNTGDSVQVTMAASASVTETVNYVQQTLAQYLAAHPEKAALFNQSGTVGGFAGGAFNISDGGQFVERISAGGVYGQYGDNYLINLLGQDGYAQLLQEFAQDQATLGGHTITSFNFMLGQTSQAQQAAPPASGSFVLNSYHPPVTLYFYNYDQGVKYEIYQNNTLLIDSASAIALTTDDINLLTGAGGQQFFNDYPEFFMHGGVPVDTGSGYQKWAGKVTFNYDPSKGNVFTIKTTESTNAYRWRWVLGYPIDGQSVGCTPVMPHFDVYPDFTANYQLQASGAWCTNGAFYNIQIGKVYTGATQIWNPVTIPAPTTSTVPFDITANWLQ